jgi:hypothetical protein
MTKFMINRKDRGMALPVEINANPGDLLLLILGREIIKPQLSSVMLGIFSHISEQRMAYRSGESKQKQLININYPTRLRRLDLVDKNDLPFSVGDQSKSYLLYFIGDLYIGRDSIVEKLTTMEGFRSYADWIPRL